MTYRGRVQNGVVVLNPPAQLPEGASVRVEVVTTGRAESIAPQAGHRQGGRYAGQISIAPDFDEWPTDIQESLGMLP